VKSVGVQRLDGGALALRRSAVTMHWRCG
jgi:hypothetical protein